MIGVGVVILLFAVVQLLPATGAAVNRRRCNEPFTFMDLHRTGLGKRYFRGGFQ